MATAGVLLAEIFSFTIKYSVFGRELTAMKLAVQYFRHLVEEREFTIYTDHRPLMYALNSNSNTLPHEERYLQYISSFTKKYSAH